MKILSGFKDYYDHVAHLYGGGDPKCLYVRTRLADREIIGGVSYAGHLDMRQKDIVNLPNIKYDINSKSYFKWLVVCGKYYLLVADNHKVYNPTWEVFTKEKFPEVYLKLTGLWSGHRKVLDAIGTFSVPLLELSRKVNAPVFTFDEDFRSDDLVIDGEVPILGNIGFTGIMDAQQIYQELSYFVGNVIKTSPDLAPVTIMSDKEKISQHGFDNKISFRNRV